MLHAKQYNGEYGCSAEQEYSCVKGIVGISPLASTLDLVASIPIDYMHNVLEGVTRWLTRAWFESRNHAKSFYIGRRVREIDNQLLKVCPPNEFSRPPRSIQKHFKYWKASELHYWLLYYSLPILMEFLPSLYWHPYALLVCAMHIMLGDSISATQVVHSVSKVKTASLNTCFMAKQKFTTSYSTLM